MGYYKHSKPRSAEHREKLSGQNHHSWSGDEPGHGTAHTWLLGHATKTGKCQKCGHAGSTEWSFLHHGRPYTRNLVDYLELCVKCHRRRDTSRRQRGQILLAFIEEHPEVFTFVSEIAETDERYTGLGELLMQDPYLAVLRR
jgi:hypothetical protein